MYHLAGPTEMVFGCGLGDLLVVRTAGHAIDDVALGSIEFGCCELETPLIVVLGHQQYGAVHAALAAFQNDRWSPGQFAYVIEALRPACKLAAKHSGRDRVDQIVQAHTVLTVGLLKKQAVLAERLKTGTLSIIGARYDLETATVDIIA